MSPHGNAKDDPPVTPAMDPREALARAIYGTDKYGSGTPDAQQKMRAMAQVVARALRKLGFTISRQTDGKDKP